MKFSRKQLNQVKRSYKDSFSDEDSNNSPSKLLRKKALKQIKEDYKKINDIKNTNNESKAKLLDLMLCSISSIIGLCLSVNLI